MVHYYLYTVIMNFKFAPIYHHDHRIFVFVVGTSPDQKEVLSVDVINWLQTYINVTLETYSLFISVHGGAKILGENVNE